MALCSTFSFHSFPLRFASNDVNQTKLKNPLFPMSFSSKSPLHLPVNGKFNNKRSIFKFRASSSNSSKPSSSGSGTTVILLSSAITVTLAVANRVLYKLALVPMKDYPFFLAQLTTFGYVVIYFTILYIRYRAGIVTDEMLAIPKLRFLYIGFLEALGVATGMSAGALLPGPVIPVLNQLMFSTLLLGRRYSINQLAGCFLVAAGVVLAIASGFNAGQMLSKVDFFWPALMIVSCAFQAGASVIKESVFIDSATRLKRKSLDIFVVNSFGSGFQALFVLLFLPLLCNLKGIPLVQLPSYLKSAADCFLNLGADKPSHDGAPLLPLLYIITNLAFNISLLNVLKSSSAVVSSLMVMLSVPISVYVLSLPLPYLPEGTSLSPFFLLGCAMLVCGLYLYNTTRPARNSSEVD
ncbi:protein CLT2, chloroplastic-like isoform X2 [Gastrolobium bilobum]|uniref:protein CLT2, chloroplastic-like isoform X2 n=1 Tax=Gastrolobium bilobum TaxID=150636 RepID=UPI002AB0DC06|nr:protein CLT2, chloroplastic-like isoform X2 [Gastrolobium bilobum]